MCQLAAFASPFHLIPRRLGLLFCYVWERKVSLILRLFKGIFSPIALKVSSFIFYVSMLSFLRVESVGKSKFTLATCVFSGHEFRVIEISGTPYHFIRLFPLNLRLAPL